VASLKPSASGASPDIVRKQGGPGSSDPGRVLFRNYALRELITEAYDVPNVQLTGPAWMMSVNILEKGDIFDLEAKMPAGTTKEQYRQMLRKLLADRFTLSVHREKQQGPVYQLVVNKGKAKVTPAPELPTGTEVPASSQLGPKGEDGFATMPLGHSGFLVTVSADSERVRNKFMRMTMGELAVWLWQRIKKPVIDDTQMQGRYDFYLEYARNLVAATATEGSTGLSIFEALQTQLSLKLVSAKGEYEMLVVDHADRTPSAN
jgi:uncharacterized protein (TIGR03435 family)